MSNIWDDIKRESGNFLTDVNKNLNVRLFEDGYEDEKNQKRAQSRVDQSMYQMQGLQNRQIQSARDFKQNESRYKGLLQDQNVKPLRLQMSQKLADNKLDASRRGLLNSGIHQKNTADTVNQYKSNYLQAMDQSQSDFDNLAADVYEAPIRTGLEMGGLQLSTQEDYYRQALHQMQSRNSALAGIGGAIGTAAGSYYGSKG